MSHIKDDGRVTDGFAAALLELSEGKSGARLEAVTYKVYARALSDLTLAQVRAAVALALRDLPGQFMPSPADLRRLVQPLADDAAILAWVGLLQAADEVGAWSDVEMGDPAAAEALVAVFGGWPQFCAMEDGPALTQHRTEFLVVYRAAFRKRAQAGTARLPGILTAQGAGAKAPVARILEAPTAQPLLEAGRRP